MEYAYCRHLLLERWIGERRLISLCPEVQEGASTPRSTSEIIGPGAGLSVLSKAAKIKNKEGSDVTLAYVKGALMLLLEIRLFQDW